MTTQWTDKQIAEINSGMAACALKAIQELLDDGGIPRGPFPDDQVRNLVAMYNQQKAKLERAREALEFYANGQLWFEDGKPQLTTNDGGKRAKAVLAAMQDRGV